MELPIAPVAKERARVTRFGAYTPQRTKEFQKLMHLHSKKYAPQEMFKGPLRLECFFFLAKPKKTKFNYPAVRPDVDNYLKAVMDSLNGIMWKDDSLIVEVMAKKVYAADKPHILIVIEELE